MSPLEYVKYKIAEVMKDDFSTDNEDTHPKVSGSEEVLPDQPQQVSRSMSPQANVQPQISQSVQASSTAYPTQSSSRPRTNTPPSHYSMYKKHHLIQKQLANPVVQIPMSIPQTLSDPRMGQSTTPARSTEQRMMIDQRGGLVSQAMPASHSMADQRGTLTGSDQRAAAAQHALIDQRAMVAQQAIAEQRTKSALQMGAIPQTTSDQSLMIEQKALGSQQSMGDQRSVPQTIEYLIHQTIQQEAGLSCSSSSQLSPEGSHHGSEGPWHQSQPVSGDSEAGSPISGSMGAPPAQGKKRLLCRPKVKVSDSEAESAPLPLVRPPVTAMPMYPPKDIQAKVASSGLEVQKPTSSLEKKIMRSEYDFPDSPDEEGVFGKSYMALSSTTRSPRRGVVDSSESRPASQTSDNVSGNTQTVESSVDDNHCSSNVDYKITSGMLEHSDSGKIDAYRSGSDVESSVGYSNQSREHSSNLHSSLPRIDQESLREIDEGSNVSQPSVDSTNSDRMVIDESRGIDSSTSHVGLSSSTEATKLNRKTDSPQSSSIDYDDHGHVSQSLSPADTFTSHHSRSPRAPEHLYGDGGYPHPLDPDSGYPQAVDSASSSISPGLPSSSNLPASSDTSSRPSTQEPAPLLLSQYETLSDDDD